MPLFVRISATEWMEWAGGPSWDLAESKRLAALLPDAGVDLLDVSSGANNPRQRIRLHPYYQVDLAAEIRAELQRQGKKLAIGAVGSINNAEMARDVAQDKADLVFVARQFLREPEFVLKVAHELGVKVQGPIQYHRAPYGKA